MDDEPAFSASYVLQLAPEFPGNGIWGCRVVHFDAEGRPGTEPGRGIGAPMYVRVRDSDDREWIASFDSSGLGRDRSVFRTPDPERFVAVVEGRAYLVSADAPDAGAEVLVDPVRQVVELVEPPLLLLASWAEIVAIGPNGPVWSRADLIDDDLHISDVSSVGITCTGYRYGAEGVPIVLDPRTGAVLSGRVDSVASPSPDRTSGWPPRRSEWTVVVAALIIAAIIGALVLLASPPW